MFRLLKIHCYLKQLEMLIERLDIKDTRCVTNFRSCLLCVVIDGHQAANGRFRIEINRKSFIRIQTISIFA
jgi:hypothetical protein